MDFSFYPHALVSSIVCLLCYKFLCPVLSSWLAQGYTNLPVAKQIEWNTRIISNFHAIIVSIVCIFVVLDENISNNPIWGNSFLAKFNCAILSGYLIADGIVVLWHYRYIGDFFTLFHHGVTLYACYFALTYGALLWFVNWRIIAELSTPMVNQRWFFDVLGYPKSSRLFLINGIAMAVVFFLVRIVIIPPYWIKVYSVYGTEACDRLGYLWYVLLSSCSLLDVINVYWFAKIVRGAVKILRSLGGQPSHRDGVKVKDTTSAKQQ